MKDSMFYCFPKQVIYRCKGDENEYAGIAVEDFVISAQTGVAVPLEGLTILKELYWLDLSEGVKGDMTEEEARVDKHLDFD